MLAMNTMAAYCLQHTPADKRVIDRRVIKQIMLAVISQTTKHHHLHTPHSNCSVIIHKSFDLPAKSIIILTRKILTTIRTCIVAVSLRAAVSVETPTV